MSFSEIPILDLSLASSPDTKPALLNDLRHALLEVGFLYIKNTGVPADLIQDVIELGNSFFDLPEEQKLKCEMVNAKSFLGYVNDPFPESSKQLTLSRTSWAWRLLASRWIGVSR